MTIKANGATVCHIAADQQKTVALCGEDIGREPWCCDHPDPSCGREPCLACDSIANPELHAFAEEVLA